MNERMNERMNEWMKMNEWLNEWSAEWTSERMNEWLNVWINEWVYVSHAKICKNTTGLAIFVGILKKESSIILDHKKWPSMT